MRALTDAQLAALLLVAPAQHRLLFELLAATGLRISEAGLRCASAISAARRRAAGRRRAPCMGAWRGASPPKSKYGRRSGSHRPRTRWGGGVRAYAGLRSACARVPWGPQDTPLHASNLLMREFKPAAEEAGVSWAGFHTLRHTCATRLVRRGPQRRAGAALARALLTPAFTFEDLCSPAQRRPRRPAPAALAGCQRGVSGAHTTGRHSEAGRWRR